MYLYVLIYSSHKYDYRYLLIVVGDLNRHGNALDYIKSLDFKAVRIVHQLS